MATPTPPHFLAELRDPALGKGAPRLVYLLLWAHVPNPFAEAPTVDIPLNDLADLSGLSRRRIQQAIAELKAEPVSLVRVKERRGMPHRFTLLRKVKTDDGLNPYNPEVAFAAHMHAAGVQLHASAVVQPARGTPKTSSPEQAPDLPAHTEEQLDLATRVLGLFDRDDTKSDWRESERTKATELVVQSDMTIEEAEKIAAGWNWEKDPSEPKLFTTDEGRAWVLDRLNSVRG